jgi:hypothetical protein
LPDQPLGLLLLNVIPCRIAELDPVRAAHAIEHHEVEFLANPVPRISTRMPEPLPGRRAGSPFMNYSDPFGLCPGPIQVKLLCAGAAIASRLPAVQRGMNNPRVQAAVQRGQQAHAAFKESMRAAGNFAEVTLKNTGRRVDGMIVDAENKVLQLIELKPDNQRALQRGLDQVGQYADDVADLIKNKVVDKAQGIDWSKFKDFTIETRVQTYP